MKGFVLLTTLTSASASLCCIVPFMGAVGGSSSLISTVSGLEPFRPLFIGGTFLLLGFAWYRNFKISKKDECGCEPERISYFRSNRFLSAGTIVAILLISFPSYSKYIQSENPIAIQEKSKKIILAVVGMTCAGCEYHIESEVSKVSGVSSVEASYQSKSATVEYDPFKVDEAKIIATINSTGYNASLVQEKPKRDCCTKGSCTQGSCSSM